MVSKKETTTTTSLVDLIQQDGARLLLEQYCQDVFVVMPNAGVPPVRPPWHKRARAWLHWHWIGLRHRVGFWIAGYNPDDEERW